MSKRAAQAPKKDWRRAGSLWNVGSPGGVLVMELPYDVYLDGSGGSDGAGLARGMRV
jgi:hypothetical protein